MIAGGGGVSLLALAIALPATHAAERPGGIRAASHSERSVGVFTPAVRDPRLAAFLERRQPEITTGFRFTPAATNGDRNRQVRVAVRARPGTIIAEAVRPPAPGASAALASPSGTQITPSSYNLGASVGWRRFAVTGDVASASGGVAGGSRESARVGVNYRANRRLTGRVEVSAERAEGVQRVVADDRALALDVGGSYSIARNIDVTGGVRYRVSRDRLEPLARDERRDSQAVYIGTAFRF